MKQTKKTIWLIDIDGTVCEDIPNEESYRFITALPLPGSVEKVKEYDKATICDTAKSAVDQT